MNHSLFSIPIIVSACAAPFLPPLEQSNVDYFRDKAAFLESQFERARINPEHVAAWRDWMDHLVDEYILKRGQGVELAEDLGDPDDLRYCQSVRFKWNTLPRIKCSKYFLLSYRPVEPSHQPVRVYHYRAMSSAASPSTVRR